MALIEGRIANRRDEMPAIARMVEGFGAEHRVPLAIVNDLNVALDEALNNIIAYGYEPGERSDIMVRLTSAAGEIVVEIEDVGRPFDPLQAPAPDLSGSLRERNVGGLGIHFIKNLVDEVTNARIAGRHRLRLRKRLALGLGTRRMEMEIIEIQRGPVLIMEPRGCIDTSGAKPFGDRLAEMVRAGSRNVLIDMEHIVYISSAGFRALLVAHKLAHDSQGKLVLCGISSELLRLFEIGRFVDLFTIC